MQRRDWLRSTGALGAGFLLSSPDWSKLFQNEAMKRSDFGPEFRWGAATAAYQIEGAFDMEGKGPSIWDTFSHRKGKIKTGEKGDNACDFYRLYSDDINILSKLSIPDFRFSFSWARIFPEGIGKINQKGIDFYHRVIDKLLEKGIKPWATLYHWDLPQALEDKGGWTNREILNWFGEYADRVSNEYGNKVKGWMVMNEPMAFTGLGYMLGLHAPGRKGPKNFLDAVYNAALCQGAGGRIIRDNINGAQIGTTFSASWVEPYSNKEKDIRAAERFDALWNRLFLEPALLGKFPVETLPWLNKLEKRYQPGDEKIMKFNFDFIGLQNYTREVIKSAIFPPVLWAKIIPPRKRTSEILTDMGWEVYPEGMYHLLKKFSAYPNCPPILVTENGAAFPDVLEDNEIHDARRTKFLQDYLAQVLRAKKEGVNVQGYFVWSLMDNFEWAEGFKPRFGLVHVDFTSQERRIKDSGRWYAKFLSEG